MADAKAKPEFTIPQAKAIRVAISFGEEGEDGVLGRTLRNARRELDRAQREAELATSKEAG
jgi:hypothetical protein